MKIAYFDCFAGISGDMLLGALLDLGLDLAALKRELRKLPLAGYRLEAARVNKRGIQATQFNVILAGSRSDHLADSEFEEVAQPTAGTDHPPDPHHPDQPQRPLAEILSLIERSDLSDKVKATATAIFTRLGQAEAQVHGVRLEQVHFHEVGGVDAIVDIVGAAIALEKLEIEQVYASPLHLGSGFVRAAHGLLPVPAPATAQLIAGVPVYSSEVKGELVTPTGAAIITTIAHSFGPLPPLVIEASGYGAGTRDREFPNVLRGYLGHAAAGAVLPAPPSRRVRDPFPQQHHTPEVSAGYHQGPATVIEANIDDMNPQLFEYLLERLLEAGALDVSLIPIQMKKSRPGTLLHVLAHPASVDELLAIIFTESTTIGARTYEVTKRMLQRETQTVETVLGPVRVKVAWLGSRVVNVAPEYEDCRELARRHNLPLKEVYALARSGFGLAGEE
ncbi:MAG: UPF0272 protein [Chloroflexota bacterium]|nr:MAG: UPF0272 protein [Chloroflexota bacterium]